MKILGIDPGSRIAGFSVLNFPKDSRSLKSVVVLDAGIIRLNTDLEHAARLSHLHNTVYDLAQQWQPDVCVLEKAFYGVNATSSLKLGEARGACLSALGRLGIVSYQLTPAEIKNSVTGHGRASKEQVYRSLRMLIGFDKGRLPYDVSDAAAIATAYIIRKPWLGTPQLTVSKRDSQVTDPK